MKSRRLLPTVWLLLMTSFPVIGQEPSVTLHATVRGNQDQPRVIYFLPWQQPGDVHFEQAFSAGLSGDLFVPITRDEFLRTLKYRAMLDSAAASAMDAAVKSPDLLLITQ
jgi:hypothetical protein